MQRQERQSGNNISVRKQFGVFQKEHTKLSSPIFFQIQTNAFPHLAEGHYFFEKLFPLNSAYHGLLALLKILLFTWL